MARIPALEDILLSVHQCLGLEAGTAPHALLLSDWDLTLARFRDREEGFEQDLFSAFGLAGQARRDAERHAREWRAFYREMATKTGTGDASERQVLWHLLAYVYVPTLAYRLALWRLAVAKTAPAGAAAPTADDDWFFRTRLFQRGSERLSAWLNDNAEAAPGLIEQMATIFRQVTRLTLTAAEGAATEEERDARLEALIPAGDRDDILLAIVPSRRETAARDLAALLTARFAALTPESPLEDLIALDDAQAAAVAERRQLAAGGPMEQQQKLADLRSRVFRASPWRTLQAESDFSLVAGLAAQQDLPEKIRSVALDRMVELAKTPAETLQAIAVRLGVLLDGEQKNRPKDAQRQIQALLDEAADTGTAAGSRQAELLRFRARHRLMQNDLSGTCDDYRAALRLCEGGSYGELHPRIAQEGLAVDVVAHGMHPAEQAACLRTLMDAGLIAGDTPSLSDAAEQAERFFWKALYQPYPGIARIEHIDDKGYKAIFDEIFRRIRQDDWTGLRVWLDRQDARIGKAGAHRDSLLLRLLKYMDQFQQMFLGQRALESRVAPQLGTLFEDIRQAARIILERWPEQAHIADVLGRTPLMLATEKGEAALTGLLAPLSEIDAQDCLGRTALHMAAASPSTECVELLAQHRPDASRVTIGNANTALHTAVAFGTPAVVAQMVRAFPALATVANAVGQTPLDLARQLRETYADWTAIVRKRQLSVGSEADYARIIQILTQP